MKKLGILGGMGAEATSLFYKKIIQNTPVNCDQDHIPTIMINETTLPDRSYYIINNQLDELGQKIHKIGLNLQNAGADYIVMPCNTVHVFLPYLKSLNIPIIDMIQETANNLKEKEITHVGILATTATLKSNLYQNKLNSIGIETVLPSNTDQDMVMKVIFDIKAGHSKKVAKEKLDSIINQFQSKNIQHIVLGCTELPLIIKTHPHFQLHDPLDILAKVCINYSQEKTTSLEKQHKQYA
tara:strand:- start:171 stop:890 length:720 start_codon:yes stop_codon:yes gene_type:complete